MIVHRIWAVKIPDPRGHLREIRVKEGWFLFGFIPLYIRCRSMKQV